LHSLSPLAILGRGYSIAQRLPDGAILRSVRAVGRGERIRLVLHEGELDATVDETRLHRSWPSVD
jgi:exodeoxyribonuclease VII large subunit